MKTIAILSQKDGAGKTQLEFLRLEIGAKSVQSLMIEAINDLFEKHGKKRIIY